MKKIILTLVFVIGIMGLTAAARAETPDWMDPDSPLALGLHPRLLFIPDSYRATHPDAFGITVSEMRAKLSHPDYISKFEEFITEMDNAFNIDISSKTKLYATYDAVNFAFLYMIDPSIMSQHGFKFGHPKEEYGDKAIEHALYIANKLKDMVVFDHFDSWCDHTSYYYGDEISEGIANIAIAVVNDWVNNKISKAQKQMLMDGIVNVYNLRSDIAPLASGKHYGYAQNGDAGVLGLYGDDVDNIGEITYQSHMSTLLDALNTDWLKGFVELSNKFYEEGSNSPQGGGYNHIAIKNMIPFIMILSTALNENYFNSVSYLREFTAYELFSIKPSPKSGRYYYLVTDDHGREEVAKDYGRYTIISNTIINSLSKDKPNYASLMKWLVTDKSDGGSGLFRNNDSNNPRLYYVFYHFFMGNKKVLPRSPAEMNLPKSKNLGMGQYTMKTGFTDPDDSMVVFFAPKYHINDGGHAHREFAHFRIIKYGDLAIGRSIAKGFSGGDNIVTQHNMFYNTIGVYKQGEDSENGYNLMGYRRGYNDKAIDPDDPAWAENGANHVGTVRADDLNGVEYDYIDYDYSNSWKPLYNYAQKVDYAEREFVYLRSAGGTNDEYVVVFDRVNSLDPAYTKYWLLHASFEPRLLDNNDTGITMTPENYSNDPDVPGGRWVNKSSSPTQDNIIEITNTWTGNNSHGRLYNKTLLPSKFQINKVGGPGHYWEDAEGKKLGGLRDFTVKPLTDEEKNDRGTYTMQVQSTTNQKSDHFLNVIQFGDSNTLTQMTPISRINTEAMVGAFIDDPHTPRVVMFSRDPKGSRVNTVSYPVEYTAKRLSKHLLVDMEEGQYDLRIYDKDNNLIETKPAITVTNKGTLYFETEQNAGKFTYQAVRTGENIPPVVSLSADNIKGSAPLAVQFTAQATSSKGSIVKYEWDYEGRGSYIEGQASASHTYNTAGAYTTKVRVTDTAGLTAATEVSITVESAGYLKEDINNDSQVDVLDVQACVNHILGLQDWGESADANKDGNVDVIDVQVVVNAVLGGEG